MKHTSLGFTGNRRGMTGDQKQVVAQFLQWINPTEVHHGECVGSDADFHEMVRVLLPECHIIGHPPKNESLHARLEGYYAESPPDTYFGRDRAVVDAATIVIGTPGVTNLPAPAKAPTTSDTWKEGGTGYTLVYAVERGKEVLIVFPDGGHKRIVSKENVK